MPTARNRRFDGVNDLFSELVRLRSLGVHGSAVGDAGPIERTYSSAWVPAADIFGDGDDLVVQIEVPGIDPPAIDLRLDRGVLKVSGTRADLAEEADYLSRERYRGEFRRAIELPDGTRPEDITADFANGLVTLRVRGAAGGDAGTRIRVSDSSTPSAPRSVSGPDA